MLSHCASASNGACIKFKLRSFASRGNKYILTPLKVFSDTSVYLFSIINNEALF